MNLYWTIFVILAVSENICSSRKTLLDVAMDELPLTKSLGYSKRNLHNLEDAGRSREYVEQYQEMLKASQEIHDKVQTEDLQRRKMDGRRQRHAYRVHSPARTRRARSEALRREKLNSQGLRSHLVHTRQSSLENHSQEFFQ